MIEKKVINENLLIGGNLKWLGLIMRESAGNSKEKSNNKSSVKKDVSTDKRVETLSGRKKRRRKKETKAFALLFLVIACLAALVFTVTVVLMDNGILRRQRLETAEWNGEDADSSKQAENLEVTVVDEAENVSGADSDLDADFDETQNGLSNDGGATDSASETGLPKEELVKDVTMIFAGDICFYDAFANMSALRSRGGNIESTVDEKLLEEMRNADICMVNNEFAYSDRGTPLAGKTYTFRSNPSNVGLLSDMGVDLVSLANNHVYDYGEDALLDTLDILKSEGIAYVGAGRNLSEASAAYVAEINGRKIAFLSATQVERNATPDTKGATDEAPGAFRCYTEGEFRNLTDAIEKMENEVDLTVVYIHWGTENTDELHWAQTDQAPKLVKAGADLIIGDHPHCLQNIEYIDDVPVIYSLGNFWFNSKTLDTGLFKVVYDMDGNLKCQFIPAKQHDCRTDLETGAEKQRILDYMQCISPNVTLDAEGNITNTPYTGPAINYAAVERVPDPPATTTTITDPATGASLLIDKKSGQILDPATGLPTGKFVNPATGAAID